MTAPEDRIRLKIDLKSGTVELEAPTGEFDLAIQKTKELASSLQLGEKVAASAQETPVANIHTSVSSQPEGGRAPVKNRERTRNPSGKTSTARAGRLGSFDPIRDLLTDAQHKELHAYMQAKGPTDQEDQVLVAVHKGEQLLGRQGFSYNEIYTLLWRAGVDPLPKAIDVVLQRLMQGQKMDRGEAGYFMKFIGQSRVEKELPSSSKDAA